MEREHIHLTLEIGERAAEAVRLLVSPPIQTQLKQILKEIRKMADDQAILEEKIAAIQASENQEAATLVAIKEAVDALKVAHPAIDFTSVDALLAASTANTAAAGDDLTDATT